jgi:O-antigen ligase
MIILVSIIIFLFKKVEDLIQLFFLLSFLIPYDFFYLTSGLKLGLIINQYFFAGLPLYLALIKVSFGNKICNKISVANKLLFILVFCIFLVTTVIPGFLFLIGIGGFSVRTALVVNYFNGLVLFVLVTSIDLPKYFLRKLFDNILIYGMILSAFGLIQYCFNHPLFTFFGFFDTKRLSVYALPDPIDGLPFLILPFMISLLKLLFNKKYTIINTFSTMILFISILLSFSRWAYFSLFISFIIYVVIISNNILRLIKRLVFGSLVIGSFLLLMYFSHMFDAQLNRLESSDNLYVRSYLWGLGLTAISSNPLKGYGIGNTTSTIFLNESNFNLLSEENSTKSVETFSQMGVHQFLIDLVVGQGVLILVILIAVTIFIFRSLGIKEPVDKLSYLYHAIFLSFLFIIIFWLQNNGSQIFLIFLFWAIASVKNFEYKSEKNIFY